MGGSDFFMLSSKPPSASKRAPHRASVASRELTANPECSAFKAKSETEEVPLNVCTSKPRHTFQLSFIHADEEVRFCLFSFLLRVKIRSYCL